MKRILITSMLLVGFSAVGSLAIAAPVVTSVSGTLDSGQAVTINGSGFGVKSPAAPLVWDTFESGANGNRIQSVDATVGRWGSGAGADNVFYSNAVSYNGSKAARHPFSSTWNSSLAKDGTFPVLYIDFKRYYPSSNGSPSNYKPWRIYGNSDAMQLYMGFGCGYQILTMHTDSGGGTDWSPVSLNGKMDAWQHYQVVYKESSVGVADGTIITYLNGKVDGWNSTAVKTRGSNTHLEQIRIGHYFDIAARDGCDPSDSSVVYTDNVYIDTTWARVELGNASTYGASTHREIQVPTSWSGNAVSVNVNTGTFASGSNVYLFIVDSTGAVSPGYGPLQVGEGSSAPPPPAAIPAPEVNITDITGQ